MSSGTDYYAVLGVPPTASQDEIKKRYKKLAVRFHPDKTQEKAHHEMFLRISKAYDTLKDEKLRSRYNASFGITSFGPLFGRRTQHFDAAPKQSPSKNQTLPRHHDPAKDPNRDPNRDPRKPLYGYFGSAPRSSREYAESFRRNPRNTDSWLEPQTRTQTDGRRGRQSPEKPPSSETKAREAQQFSDLRQQMHDIRAQAAWEKEVEEQRVREEAKRREEEMRREALRREELRREELKREEAQRREELRREERAKAEREHAQRLAQQLVEKRRMEAASRQPEQTPQEQPEQDSAEVYLRAKKTAQRRSWHPESAYEEFPETPLSDPESGHPQEPIVVDDEPDSNGSSYFTDEAGSDHPPEAPHNPHPPKSGHTPEVVEVSDSELPFKGVPLSPARRKADDSVGQFPNQASRGAKKARLANYDELRATLGTGLNEVDFSDLRSTLPPTLPHARKASEQVMPPALKRAKVEYTTGRSLAQTLFMPVNKPPGVAHNTITSADLSPALDDRLLIFDHVSPQIKVHRDMVPGDWDRYVKAVHAYERNFLRYRRAVLQYQMGRFDKDEAHHNVVYSDTLCLHVYRGCLFNDMLLMQSYTRALQEFRQTLMLFEENCLKVQNLE